MALLLYYISGGNQTPKFEVTDKVRAEDQDLRGWFKQAYGTNYLTRLTNTEVDDYLFTSITVNSDKVAKIKAEFDINDYGYSLRVGAINDYHIGRIVTHADNMTNYQNEAKKYAKEIATLCAKLLLGGEPPNNNIFDILHSSLRVWYGTQGKDLPVQLTNSLAVSRVIEQSKSDGTKIYADYNHTRYTYELICALFDMHCFALPKDTWVVDGTVQEILDKLDGVSSAYLTQQAQAQTRLDAEIAALGLEVSKKEAQTRPDAPRFTPDMKQKFQNFIYLVENQGYGKVTDKGDRTKAPFFVHYVPIANNLQAYKDAVNNLQVLQATAPRGLIYDIVQNKYVSSQFTPRNTTALWYPYDQYIRELQALKDQKAAKEAELLQVTTDLTTERGKDKLLSDWHKTPAVEITKLLAGADRSAWLDYIYNTVKTQYGLNYVQKEYGAPPQPYPRLLIPTIPGQVITGELNTIDVSRMILLYGKALQGVTPTAYWSTSLSHRLVVRTTSDTECQVYLHTANMKTGGITGNSSALIATIHGDVSSAKVLVASYLPDVPFYTPGTNITLSTPLKDSFVTKIQSDPKLSQWLRTSMKDQFQYAYVIQSAWSPQTPPPTYLLGTKTSSRQSSYDTHIDWLRATTYAGQRHKGVTTFKPSLSTLQYDPFGDKPNSSFFQSSAGLSATRMICVGFPKSAVSKITEFMKTVPAQIEALLKQVTDKSNSPWYEARLRLSPNQLYGNIQTVRTDWPEYGDSYGFLNDMEILRKFLFNRTESLFIYDINTVVETAYKEYKENKPEFVYESGQSGYMDVLDQDKYAELTKTYDMTKFGTAQVNPYEDYMALLGAIAYFNSFEMLTDTSYQRNYALWAKPFKNKIKAIVDRVIGSAVPQRIYEDNINDTEDVSNLHKILQSLGTFEGMSEMPVFDVEEFHFTWTPIGSQASAPRDSPFDKQGLVDVPVDGLRPRAFRGLKGQYGDVFYHAITDTCVVRPNIVHSKDSGYVYSSIRVPVSTRGVSSKVYGLRPGTTYGLELGTQFLQTTRLESGAGRLTNAGLASVTGLAFAGIIGYHMVKNIASETAFDDKRFRFDDVN